jgi:hypothetical protein
MRLRFCLFDRSIGARNFEETRKLSKRLSQRVAQSVDSVLRPDVSEDESRDDETEKNSNDAIANVIEISIGRISLEDAVEKSKCYLEARIRNHFAPGGDPTGDG